MTDLLKEKLEQLQKKCDGVSKEILDAERMLRAAPLLQTAEYGNIKWDAERKRIIFTAEDRPLIECKMQQKLDGHYYLACLIEKVLIEANERFEKKDQIQTNGN